MTPSLSAPMALIRDRVLVVLDHPQDVVNIAGVVRAMLNMGLRKLRLVAPAEFDTWRIEGIAHRSHDLLRETRIFHDLPTALEDVHFVIGTTARPRTAQRNYLRPEEAAALIPGLTAEGSVALLFGREDRGLDNAALDLCHRVVVIPTDPGYPSLNLAQAVLLLAYEVFKASTGGERPLPRGRRSTRPATVGELEQTYAALESALHRIDFFKARTPEAIMRTLRTVISRAEPDLQEAGLLRAIGFEVGYFLDRRERETGERPGTELASPSGRASSRPGKPGQEESMSGREDSDGGTSPRAGEA